MPKDSFELYFSNKFCEGNKWGKKISLKSIIFITLLLHFTYFVTSLMLITNYVTMEETLMPNFSWECSFFTRFQDLKQINCSHALHKDLPRYHFDTTNQRRNGVCEGERNPVRFGCWESELFWCNEMLYVPLAVIGNRSRANGKTFLSSDILMGTLGSVWFGLSLELKAWACCNFCFNQMGWAPL